MTQPIAATAASSDWEQRGAALWNDFDKHLPEAFVNHIRRWVAELPAAHPIAAFELACAQDSTGHPDLAVPLYRAALQGGGLTGLRRRRATVQLASSLRNLGHPEEAAVLLAAEISAASDELDGAVRAFLALALADLGREREALCHSLTALSTYLPRYNRSLARYAAELTAAGGDALVPNAGAGCHNPLPPLV
jgi:Tetratrico peptide repeat